MENIMRMLSLKETRLSVYENFVTEVSSSKEKSEGYKAQCDMELSKLERNPKSNADFYTMKKFLTFIYDAEFDKDFYNEHVTNVITSFDKFLQKQTDGNDFKELFFEHSESFKNFSPTAFGNHLSFYEDLFQKEEVSQMK